MEAQSTTTTKSKTVAELQAVKRSSGKTYSQLAEETGLTNVYVAQLLRRQAQLKPATAPRLRAALPGLTEDHLLEMAQPPLRSYDPNLIQDPTVYRLNEAIMHFGESIKEIINEEFGDGIFLHTLCAWATTGVGFVLYTCAFLNPKILCLPSLGLLSSLCSVNLIYLLLPLLPSYGWGTVIISMSAIDFYCSVDKIKGVDGKERAVVTLDGKYLPYTEQISEHMVSRLSRKDNKDH